MTKKQKTELRDNLIRCRRAYAERGAKLIEVTHLDGTKSGIANPKAVKAAMDALKVELDRQIEELGGDPERSGLNEVVRDWMLRDHPGRARLDGRLLRNGYLPRTGEADARRREFLRDCRLRRV